MEKKLITREAIYNLAETKIVDTTYIQLILAVSITLAFIGACIIADILIRFLLAFMVLLFLC